MNEEQLENLCLDWFREGGWDVLHGPDIAPDSDHSFPRSRVGMHTDITNG